MVSPTCSVCWKKMIPAGSCRSSNYMSNAYPGLTNEEASILLEDLRVQRFRVDGTRHKLPLSWVVEKDPLIQKTFWDSPAPSNSQALQHFMGLAYDSRSGQEWFKKRKPTGRHIPGSSNCDKCSPVHPLKTQPSSADMWHKQLRSRYVSSVVKPR